MRRLGLVSAVLLIASFAVAQAIGYGAPLLGDPSADLQAELAQVGRSENCDALRAQYNVEHQVWKQAVKKRAAADDQAHEAMMRAILGRLEALAGACSG